MAGNMIGFNWFVSDETDDDIATDRAIIARYHIQRTDGSWDSLVVSGYYYEKNEDGEWIY